MKTEYIVKAWECELGEKYFIVTVPENTSEDNVWKNFEMARKYASVTVYSNPEDYDKHFDDMLDCKEFCNGYYTFNYYLEKHCGYKVDSMLADYEYEW